MKNKKLIIKSVIIAFNISFIVLYAWLNIFDNTIKDEKQITKITEDFLRESTSLGKEEDIIEENFYVKDGYHIDLREIGCSSIQDMTYPTSNFQQSCVNFTEPSKQFLYSDNLVISYPTKIIINNIKIKKNKAIVTANVEIKEHLSYLECADVSSDGTLLTETSKPFMIENIHLELIKDDNQWYILKSNNIESKLKNFYCLWDDDTDIYYDIKMERK